MLFNVSCNHSLTKSQIETECIQKINEKLHQQQVFFYVAHQSPLKKKLKKVGKEIDIDKYSKNAKHLGSTLSVILVVTSCHSNQKHSAEYAFPLMLLLKLPVVDSIHQQSNKVAIGMENEAIGESNLTDNAAVTEEASSFASPLH